MVNLATPRLVAATVSADGALAAGKHNPVAASSARTMTLPTTATAGAALSVTKTAGASTVTITGHINGSSGASVVLTNVGEVIELTYSGTSWWITGGFGAGGGGAVLPQLIQPAVKPADTVRNNVGGVGSEQADPDLSVPVVAGATYLVSCLLGYNATATADLRVSWSGPATGGTTMTSFLRLMTSVATSTTSVPATSIGSIGAAMVIGGIGGNTWAELRGTLFVGTAGGALGISWSQGTAEASDITMLKGSSLSLTRIA